MTKDELAKPLRSRAKNRNVIHGQVLISPENRYSFSARN